MKGTALNEVAKTSYGNPDINEILEAFEKETGLKLVNIKKQRQFASILLKREGKLTLRSAITFVAGIMDDKYAPRVSDIEKLYYKWGDLQLYGRKKQNTLKETAVADLNNL